MYSLSAAIKNMWTRIDAMFAEREPRQAVVTRSAGGMVWVRFVGESSTSPESTFPTTLANVPVGTRGWVYPTGGGKGVFVVTGMSDWDEAIIHFAGAAAQTTTSTTAGTYFWYSGAGETTIPFASGRWEIIFDYSIVLRRSVANGAVWQAFEVDGTVNENGHDPGGLASTPATYRHIRTFTLNVATPRNVRFRMGFRGGSTNGTTYGLAPIGAIRYRRTGDAS